VRAYAAPDVYHYSIYPYSNYLYICDTTSTRSTTRTRTTIPTRTEGYTARSTTGTPPR